ncbi:hypothetical protein TNCV_3290761 [Trichonephila clavipes]|nr:hypothetical protein TNCV_3290761 [Trichonephila clavipes]
MPLHIILLVDDIILRGKCAYRGEDYPYAYLYSSVIPSTMMREPRECQENIHQIIMLPSPVQTATAMIAGRLLSEVSHRIRQRLSVRWNVKRDSSKNATYRPSGDIQWR